MSYKVKLSPGRIRAGNEQMGGEVRQDRKEADRGIGQGGKRGMLGSGQWDSCKKEGPSGEKSRSWRLEALYLHTLHPATQKSGAGQLPARLGSRLG